MQIDERYIHLRGYAPGGLRPWPEVVQQNAILEHAPRQRRHQHRLRAGGAGFLDVAAQVGGKFCSKVGGSAGLAGLIVGANWMRIQLFT